jgi:two-component system, NtrC family, response regulator AtoC
MPEAAPLPIAPPSTAPAGTQVFLGMTAIIASEPMQRLMELVRRVARSTATTLITGESGVGKELVARAVHYHSGRASKAWVDFNCAALPEQLLESELFGHERGAFSGADSTKPGLFELAHQGTIFLDEVGELDARLQVKLLRVLDGAPYYRLGGVRKVSVDVRVVAATNRDLERAVAQGRFRSDLFHRLSQFTLHVPPLRVRHADIEPLARHFLAEHFPELELHHSAVAALCNYSWPGNIRELRNAVIQAGVMSQSREIKSQDFRLRPSLASVTVRRDDGEGSEGLEEDSRSLEAMERRMIEEALAATGGHQQKAAARLGISRRTLSRKLKSYESDQHQRVAL